MKAAVIGCGKLGFPVAVGMAVHHQVTAFDVVAPQTAPYPHRELGPFKGDDFQDYVDRVMLDQKSLTIAPYLPEAVRDAEIVFVAVQTPHRKEYEGVTRLPASREDFDYSFLRQAVKDLDPLLRPEQVVVIISTVLPGTVRREVLPLLTKDNPVVYNPHFVAMGQVLWDFFHPEFVLAGGDVIPALNTVRQFYQDIHLVDKVVTMSVESAELTKVAYNVILETKINIANHLAEICHKTPGCDVDDVTRTLQLATDRIVSPRYMNAGMAGGGGCHPRDCIAMSHLSRKLNLSSDLFGDAMHVRERYTQWLFDLLTKTWREHWEEKEFGDYGSGHKALPIVLLGKSYKPETNLTAGSPALLLADMLTHFGVPFSHLDPFVDEEDGWGGGAWKACLFFIATKHEQFRHYKFPAGSVVVDPFRYIPEQHGVKVIPVGVGPQA